MPPKNPEQIPVLVTGVGRIRVGDNDFRGYSVGRDLAGRYGLWSLMSVAVGGPLLESDDAQVLEDMAGCAMLADPRAWPL